MNFRADFISVVVCLLLVPGAGIAQPAIAIKEGSSIDFGRVYQGSRPTRTLTIVNRGTARLKIEHVDSPCECTSTALERSELDPNDSARLVVTFNSENYIDSVRKEVIIVSNDYPHRNVFVTVHAFVASVLRISPYPVTLGDVGINRPESLLVQLTNTGRKRIRIRKISTTEHFLTASASRTALAPGDTASLLVTLRAAAEKMYSGCVVIGTDSKLQPKIRIWVSGMGVRN